MIIYLKKIQKIIKRKIQLVTYYLKYKEQKQIEEWTGLKCTDIVFDSNIDNWSPYTTVLNERITGKKQLIFLIEEEDGEKFGYYLNTEVIGDYDYWQEWMETDYKSFHFNLQSNGRLPQPMKFEIKDLKFGGYHLYEKSDWDLIQLGDIWLKKENYKNYSCCYQNEWRFDYHGIEKALCGKTNCWNPFTPKRILVIQMK